MRHVTLLAALACALSAAPALAQQAQDTTTQDELAGRTSISFGLNGGGEIGLWRQLSPRTRLGIEVGTGILRSQDDDNDQRTDNISIQPSVMLFGGVPGTVRPYTIVGMHLQQYSQRSEQEDPEIRAESRIRSAGVRAGAGLEWRPASRVAIGGHVGLAASFSRQTLEYESPTTADEDSADSWTFGTFSSGVSLHLFF